MYSSIAFFMSFLDNEFGKSARDRHQKVDSDVVLYREHDGSLKVVGLEKISAAGLNNFDEFRRRPHGADLKREFGSDLFVIKVVLIYNNRFLIPCLCELHCTLMDDVSEILGDVRRCGLNVW